MAPSDSHLNFPKYGYDLVVATTQESINAGLVQYLQNTTGKAPISYLCFLADDKGNPVIEKSLDELMQLSGGINPFDIPKGTPWTDSRIQKLFQVRFVCGIRLQTGIPPGVIKNDPNKGPQLELPAPIVTLGASSDDVLFNMYCSDITVIKVTLGNGWGAPSSWDWFSQQSGHPWYVQTRTSLLVSDLDKNLDTPYFQNHPDEKAALLHKLVNLSGSAYSLQQLLFDLDNAVAQSVPTFVGITDPSASYLLGLAFIKLWSSVAKERGLPLVGVSAVAQHPDGSPLQVTGLERWVSPVVALNTGDKLTNPNLEQMSATTLNYLCMVDGNPMPGPSAFNWNWIEPAQLAQSSGVIAIKRKTFARYLVSQMLPHARKSCILPWTKVEAYNVVGGVNYALEFTPGQEPKVTFTENGPLVATIDYYHEARAKDSKAATYGELNVTSAYSCNIAFGNLDSGVSNNKFSLTQNLKINIYTQWSHTGSSANVVDKTLFDEYIISSDDHGSLISKSTGVRTSTDHSESGNASSIANAFTHVNNLIEDAKRQNADFLNAQIDPFPFDQIKNFVFPGARVFSFKEATFSKWQDLTCLITYVNPTDNQLKLQALPVHAPAQEQHWSPVMHVKEIPHAANQVLRLRAGGRAGMHLAKAYQTHANPASSQIPRTNGIDTRKNNVPGNEDGMESFRLLAPSAASSLSKNQAPTVNLSASTDLMLNYVQGKLVQPQGKFRALQTSGGHALLFAVDSSGVFNVISETTGKNQTGWTTTDISSAIIKSKYPSGGKVGMFDVGQSVLNHDTISMGMSVRVDNSDTLFLSLLNSPNTTSSWFSNPNWRAFPFDAQNKPSSVQITNIYFSDVDQGQQYIMVDILRDPSSTLRNVARYIVDPLSTSGVYWKAHELPFDVEQDTYQSCVGRVSGAYFDGIYTSGTVAGAGQLAYVPLFNLTGNAAPMPTRLLLPNKTPATAIAAARNDHKESSMYGTTDLYAVGESTLYRWKPDQQLDDDSVGKAVMTNPVFAGTDSLVALFRNQITTIFGKNASNMVYYTSCPVDKLDDPSAWSVPVPVLSGIERITSYINLKDGGNTVFCAGGAKIQQLTQATGTQSKMWQAQNVTLAASSESKAMSFQSYTTTLQVTGSDNLGVGGAQIDLTTNARTPVYINGLYYVLSTVPVTVAANHSGQLAIVQATDGIVGATITAKAGTVTETIKPMDKSFAKLAALNNKEALRKAQIMTNIVAGGLVGPASTAPLVSSSVSDDDLQAAAVSISHLNEAYDQHLNSESSSSSRVAMSPPAVVVTGHRDLRMAIGDLLNWLKTGVEKVIQFIKNAATGFWEFVVKIAGQVYHAILDTVEAVVGAVQWVFDKIETGIEKVIHYVQFLFDWDDIKRTKQIMHNMCKYYLQDMVSDIKTVQSQFDNSIGTAQTAVSKWSGMKDWSGLGDTASKPPKGNVANYTKNQTAGSQMLANHFQDHADNITYPNGIPKASLVQKLIDDLIDAIASEGHVFQETFDQLKSLAKEFESLNLSDILKRLAGILTNSVLGSTQVVVDALLNIVYEVASSAIEVLDTKIHIPIVSDILNAIGVPDVSFLDLITWIGAASITIIYKITHGKALFPDDEASRTLAQAGNWESFSAVVQQPEHMAAMGRVRREAFEMPIKFSQTTSIAIYSTGHSLTAWAAYTGNFLYTAEAMETSPDNAFGLPSAVMGIIGALGAGAADTLVRKMPLQNTAMSRLRRATTVVTVASKLCFSGLGQKYLTIGKLSFLKVNDNRKVGAVVNSFLVFPALICSCYHFAELAEKPESKERSCAILGETASMVSYVNRISYTVALFDPDVKTRIIPVTVMAGGNLVICGLETANASIV